MKKRGRSWLCLAAVMLFCALFASGPAMAEEEGEMPLAGDVVATVTVDGQTKNFERFDRAWDYARETGKAATINLLQSVETRDLRPTSPENNVDFEPVFFVLDGDNITLEMANGVEITSGADNQSEILVVKGGSFTLKNGCIKANDNAIAMTVSGGTVKIESGELSGSIALNVWQSGTVKPSVEIRDSIFEGVGDSISCTEPIFVRDLPEYGYAFWQGDEATGHWVSEDDLNGLALSGKIKVKPAPAEITVQPDDQIITYGNDVSLSISTKNAVGYEDKTISHTWYRVTESGEEEIGTETTCTYSGLTAGSHTFYCAVTCDGVRIKSRTVTVTVEQKPLTVALSGTGSEKVYDGTDGVDEAALGLRLDLDGVISGDDVTATASSYTYNSPNVPEATTITANGITLGGNDRDNYKLSSDSAGMAGRIQKAAGSLTVPKTSFTVKYGASDFLLDFSYKGDGAVRCVSDREDTAAVSADGTVTIQGAGTAEITISLAEGENYTGAAAQTVAVRVEKADAPVLDPEIRNYSCAAGSNGAVAIDVAGLLPRDRGTTDYTFVTRDTEPILSGVSVDANGKLTYTAQGNRTAGLSAAVEVKAEMQNYETAVFTVEINLVDKKEVELQPGGSVSLKKDQIPTEGQKLSELEFAPAVFVEKGTNKPVEGVLVWRRPSLILRVGDEEEEWIFIPDDSQEYVEQTGTLSFIVVKKPEKEDAPNMPSKAITVSHRCETVGDVELPADWEWRETDREIDLVVGKAVEATALYTGEDREDYRNITVVVAITRSECEHGETERRGVVQAGCETEGYTGDVYCKECGAKLESGRKTGAEGHNWQEAVIREPDFDNEGRRRFTCSKCGASYEEAIPKRPQESESPSEPSKEPPSEPSRPSEPSSEGSSRPSETQAVQEPENTESPDTGDRPRALPAMAAAALGFGIFFALRSVRAKKTR